MEPRGSVDCKRCRAEGLRFGGLERNNGSSTAFFSTHDNTKNCKVLRFELTFPSASIARK